jgi:ABC-2 type transport system ATP-binding protein
MKPGWFWALRDVDLEVAPGEAVALIGANGSGKSTLLKILTGAMFPYAGGVATAGRVGALIEIAAGLHPQLSGRENVFLYGSLLGMRRKEVASRLEEILDFSELTHSVDRQLKFYSSGMRMRLGFSVAAFLEPDILLVDEALAVGDISFQEKCMNRMRGMLSEGRTLIFVSHDLAALREICRRGVWLEHGSVQKDGQAEEVISAFEVAMAASTGADL